MRYALILAGGSGTRLWPMSKLQQPKQLIPFVNGKSLLQIAYDRLEGLVESSNRYICAGNAHKDIIIDRLDGFDSARFLGEPTGRDTLNALAYSSAIISKKDPDAVIAVFTADHIIEPQDEFRRIVEKGYRTAEENDNTLVTFGIAPTYAATGFGYLELGDSVSEDAMRLKQFREKPALPDAEAFLKAGAGRYLWNSGMFVWKASTLLACVEKYEPECFNGIMSIAETFDTDGFEQTLETVYPELKKISIDFAVMEPASSDEDFCVAAVPMPLTWLDIGSWSSYGEICEKDQLGNSSLGCDSILHGSRDNLVLSDNGDHLIAGIGLENMIIIQSGNATLICPKDRDQDIKKLYDDIKETYGDKYI